LQERMNGWLDLKRRYGPLPEHVRERREQMAQKLATQSDVEGALAQLESERDKALEVARKKAEALQVSREKAAVALSKRVNKLLKSLGFKSARIQIVFKEETRLHEYGSHKVQMLFEPNPGSTAQLLGKIASSGETARVMLAIKTALADREATPVLVFDEVDANVGGEIGMEVGRELASLGERHQVLCITHLPQVASQARTHIRVSKQQKAKSTRVTIEPLPSLEARVEEIARMLGDRQSDTALSHARELLERFQ